MRRSNPVRFIIHVVVAAATTIAPARADEVTVAVAANFLRPLREIATEFDARTEHRAVIVSGSTGQLYAQIVNGAPYEILLAADRDRPSVLAERGLGEPASVFTYASGRLALWSSSADRVGDDTLGSLGTDSFRSFAIADPDVAPYGAAARETLESLGVWQSVESRLVRGQSVAQAFVWVETGNAELGLVALSQALTYAGPASYRVVPAELHQPIRQDAILLEAGLGKPAAEAFLAFLRGPEAAAIISGFGYFAGASEDEAPQGVAVRD